MYYGGGGSGFEFATFPLGGRIFFFFLGKIDRDRLRDSWMPETDQGHEYLAMVMRYWSVEPKKHRIIYGKNGSGRRRKRSKKKNNKCQVSRWVRLVAKSFCYRTPENLLDVLNMSHGKLHLTVWVSDRLWAPVTCPFFAVVHHCCCVRSKQSTFHRKQVLCKQNSEVSDILFALGMTFSTFLSAHGTCPFEFSIFCLSILFLNASRSFFSCSTHRSSRSYLRSAFSTFFQLNSPPSFN